MTGIANLKKQARRAARAVTEREPELYVNRQGYLDFGIPPKNLPRRPIKIQRRKPGEPIIPEV